MESLRQIEANRRNAQLSSGPRSIEGKASSRYNSLKIGIHARSLVIPGEDPAELEALNADYRAQFRPASPLENFLVDALVTADWKLRRLRRAEAELWTQKLGKVAQTGSGNEQIALAQAFNWNGDDFLRLQRHLAAAERSYYRALKELQSIETTAPDLPSEPVEAPEPPELGSFRTPAIHTADPAVATAILSPSRCKPEVLPGSPVKT